MKKVFLSALAISAMASCSKTELSNTPDGSVEIKAKSTALSISTKPLRRYDFFWEPAYGSGVGF